MSENWNEFLAGHTVGDVVDGTVSKVLPFGAFVRVGGFDGLLPQVKTVADGERVRVRILAIDDASQRFSLEMA
ncbi:S1 RNA-binding domain-containing protein [Kutzneria sp. CA-103260]|uniref:S1 RNA-binding domain-containing protein n=1 Tax=Kutzneria sp. CA-103260 TaxID=2802641 RepID=UPI001BAB9D73|nr:S1 RNA-binding domain-containing protein [Kutzneria sp. CA-103260]QUQ70134.1 30S ribosomal protein S1 [Kutzneria sp. CA-103260]